jgi:hypothetical protein
MLVGQQSRKNVLQLISRIHRLVESAIRFSESDNGLAAITHSPTVLTSSNERLADRPIRLVSDNEKTRVVSQTRSAGVQ